MVKKGLVSLKGQDMYLKHKQASNCITEQSRMLKLPDIFNLSFLDKPRMKPLYSEVPCRTVRMSLLCLLLFTDLCSM